MDWARDVTVLVNQAGARALRLAAVVKDVGIFG